MIMTQFSNQNNMNNYVDSDVAYMHRLNEFELAQCFILSIFFDNHYQSSFSVRHTSSFINSRMGSLQSNFIKIFK